MFSTSSPTYPASVRLVASATAKGTSRNSAKVCANNVLPLPVGPISKMFDFCSLVACKSLELFSLFSSFNLQASLL